MSQVYKYALQIAPGVRKFAIQGEILPLSLQIQKDTPTLWAEVKRGDFRTVNIESVMTGQMAPHGKYIGTALLERGDFVLHYYLQE